MSTKPETVFILSVTSGIGGELASRYASRGARVVGTHSPGRDVSKLKGVDELLECDVGDPKSVEKMADTFKNTDMLWDVFIACVATPVPLKPFMESDMAVWSESFYVNSTGQFHALQSIWEMRNRKRRGIILNNC